MAKKKTKVMTKGMNRRNITTQNSKKLKSKHTKWKKNGGNYMPTNYA